jgi:2-dehydropantoate 2-reductase
LTDKVENTYAMHPFKTSMLLDYGSSHPVETKALVGDAVRDGKRAGSTSPNLESLYELKKLKELKYGL